MFERISEYDRKLKIQENECISLKATLKKKEEKCKKIENRNCELTDEMQKITKENAEMKNELQQCQEKMKCLNDELKSKDIRLIDLDNENQKLKNEKKSFNDRLNLFIQDVSFTDSETMRTGEFENEQNNKKRTNDISLIIEESTSTKRQKTIDSQENVSNPSNDSTNNQNCSQDFAVESVESQSVLGTDTMIDCDDSTNASN